MPSEKNKHSTHQIRNETKKKKSIHLITQGIEGGGRSGHLGSVVFDKFLVSFERFTFIHFCIFLKILCGGISGS